MNFVSVRIITADVARLVGFYERVTGVTAAWANEDFAEIGTASGTLAIGSTRTVPSSHRARHARRRTTASSWSSWWTTWTGCTRT